MKVDIHRVDWPFSSTFRTANQVSTHAETVVVELRDGRFCGRGEGMAVPYHGETATSLASQLALIRQHLVNGASRHDIQDLLPPGGARNAVDCAFWDLEAKRAGCRAWELAGLKSVNPLRTAYTLSLDTPEIMSRAAASAQQYSLLKLKLSGNEDLQRVSAVRAARPDADLIVDANQAWTELQLREVTPSFAELGVKLIEQPLAVGNDEMLTRFKSLVPLCADESCLTSESIPLLVGKYEYISIKLDKSGGLTEALRLAQAAQERNLKLMVGCMAGSSLSMAPAFIIGQLCSIVDLDGPLLSASDVSDPIHYEGSRMFPPDARLWG